MQENDQRIMVKDIVKVTRRKANYRKKRNIM